VEEHHETKSYSSTLVKGGTALATSGALTEPGCLEWGTAWAQTALWKPERDAQLSLLRWKYFFVRGEDTGFVAVMNAFTKATGVKVNVIRESDDDVQPMVLVAANAGAGPDLIWGFFSLGVTAHPNAEWLARQLTEACGWDEPPRS
jgi:multiple sugar transport system substrate-binding protein